MSGLQLIEWAVAQCKRDKVPPMDATILDRIRGLYSIDAASLRTRVQEEKGSSE